MRDCPVCESSRRDVVWSSDFLVPDGWTKPAYLEWCECKKCGMLYADNPHVTQADYDTFYKERYGFGVTDEGVRKRLAKRALYITEHFPAIARVVDFGGGEGGLTDKLKMFGFEDVTNYGVGDKMPGDVDVIIAEHVMEHIYNMESAMETITDALKEGGMFIVDIPDAGQMAFDLPAEMPMLDFSQVHINHFRMLDMLKLADYWGFELMETSQYWERFIRSRMFVFIKGANIDEMSSKYVSVNIIRKVTAMQAIGDRDVIVWGCGDIALHCLALHPLNVVYYVDIDPAFRGATIGGVPVHEKPYTDHPIVVNCSTQKSLLLDYIKAQGYTNEVIVI
jgi:SAM-dependent methyltransferase